MSHKVGGGNVGQDNRWNQALIQTKLYSYRSSIVSKTFYLKPRYMMLLVI